MVGVITAPFARICCIIGKRDNLAWWYGENTDHRPKEKIIKAEIELPTRAKYPKQATDNKILQENLEGLKHLLKLRKKEINEDTFYNIIHLF